MAGTQVLPSPVIAQGGFMDWAQSTAGLVISRAVDAEFIRKTGVNADVTTWPGYDEQGRPFNQGNARAPTVNSFALSTPLLIGAGLLAVGLLIFLMKD